MAYVVNTICCMLGQLCSTYTKAAVQIKAQCEAAGKCDMGGFTRILHSGQPDDLMNELPTFVATPLPDEHNQG